MKEFWKTLIVLLLLVLAPAHAEESKESGGGQYAKLETFTVNLEGLRQYLQVDMSLKVADPKVIEAIKEWSPVIRHESILLLSSQKAEDISTLAGKHTLMLALRGTVNKVLKRDEKDGVTDVLFVSFVIQ